MKPRSLALLAVAALLTAYTTIDIINTANPARSQTAPTPGVGFFHINTVDDPCPTTNPTCTDHRNQKVPLNFWYPITDTAGLNPGTLELSDGTAANNFGTITLPNVYQGGTNRITGQHPVIVFSHGSGGAGIQNHSLMVDLAKAGYIIVAPDHRGHSLIDTGLGIPLDGFATTAIKRNLDMKFALNLTTAILSPYIARTAPQDPVAVAMGHSMGAMTAYTMPTGINAYLPPDARFDVSVAIDPQPVIFNEITPLYNSSGLILPNLLGSLQKPVLTIAAREDHVAWQALIDDVGRSITAAPVEERVDISDSDHTATTDVWTLKTLIDATSAPQAVKESLAGTAEGACPDETEGCVARFHQIQSGTIRDFLNRTL